MLAETIFCDIWAREVGDIEVRQDQAVGYNLALAFDRRTLTVYVHTHSKGEGREGQWTGRPGECTAGWKRKEGVSVCVCESGEREGMMMMSWQWHTSSINRVLNRKEKAKRIFLCRERVCVCADCTVEGVWNDLDIWT